MFLIKNPRAVPAHTLYNNFFLMMKKNNTRSQRVKSLVTGIINMYFLFHLKAGIFHFCKSEINIFYYWKYVIDIHLWYVINPINYIGYYGINYVLQTWYFLNHIDIDNIYPLSEFIDGICWLDSSIVNNRVCIVEMFIFDLRYLG